MSHAALFICALMTTQATFDAPASSTIHDVIFYNARLALREDRGTDALKLWLLRNSVVDTGRAPTQDAEFRSVVWAALGNLALCQDGYPKDTNGAGLWPLAMHNWLLNSVMRGGPEEQGSPFDALEAGLQQRFVSLRDVLSAEELGSVSFFRSNCWAPQVSVLDDVQAPWGDLNDRLISGPLLRSMLVQSLKTLARDKVRNINIIEARLFDLDVAMAALRLNASKMEGQRTGELARAAGASDGAIRDLRARAAKLPPSSKDAVFLSKALSWPVSDWLALSQARRLSLFAQARAQTSDPATTDLLVLGIIDALIEEKAGGEIESWLGWLDAKNTVSRRELVIAGERGKRLLELDPASTFRERAIIALHRGLAFLEHGDLREALGAFAFAMATAETSREANAVTSLARRWLAFVLARYSVNEDLIATLTALVPKQEYNSVIEDLVWRAALNADEKSFELLVRSARRGSAFDSRINRLRLLARGSPGELVTQLRDAAAEEPFFTIRFVRQLVERLEAEEVDVRRANMPLLKLLSSSVLDSMVAKAEGKASASSRTAEELLGRIQSMLEALKAFEPTSAEKARAISPLHEAFAGNIRVAPTDPLPWPFDPPEPEAPSAFTPLVLMPIEWLDANGGLVFGWRLSE